MTAVMDNVIADTKLDLLGFGLESFREFVSLATDKEMLQLINLTQGQRDCWDKTRESNPYMGYTELGRQFISETIESNEETYPGDDIQMFYVCMSLALTVIDAVEVLSDYYDLSERV